MTDLNEPVSEVDTDNSSTPQANSVSDEAPQSEWNGLSEDNLNYVKTKFKDVNALADSYRNLEKLSSNKVSIPEDGDEEGKNKLYTKLGKPASASEYDIEVDDSIKSKVQDLLLANHATKKQASGLVDGYNKILADHQQALQAQSEKELEEIVTEWGDNAEKNKELMSRGANFLAETFGVDKDLLGNIELQLGTKNFVKGLTTIAEMLSEDGLPVGSSRPSDGPMELEEYYKQL